MAISEVPDTTIGHPYEISIPLPPDVLGMTVSATITFDSQATEQQLDATFQSLIDHLQQWPAKRADMDVTGQKYKLLIYPGTPTDPAQ